MATRPTARDTDDTLDLPPLDGEEEELEAGAEALDGVEEDAGDLLDDATGEDEPLDDHGLEGEEGGWLDDAEDAAALDVGPLDLGLVEEGKLLLDDAVEAPTDDEDLIEEPEGLLGDSGEEGPLAADEELREEDLPALDADGEGELEDAALYDRAAFSEQDELRWADRAWARVPIEADGADDADDSGALAVPGEDPAHAARDAAWRRLDDSGHLTAAALLPGGSVVVAIDAPDGARALLVRIQADGEATIIAEVEGGDADDGAVVDALRWDAQSGSLIAAGPRGRHALGGVPGAPGRARPGRRAARAAAARDRRALRAPWSARARAPS